MDEDELDPNNLLKHSQEFSKKTKPRTKES